MPTVMALIIKDPADPTAASWLEGLIRTMLPSADIQTVGGDDAPLLPPDPPVTTAPTSSGNGAKATATAPPRTRGRPPKDTPAATADPLADVAGPADPDDDDGDALGLVPSSLSPGEMHAQGLVMSRALFNGGHKADVKSLQQQLGIAKFTDIPLADGPRLYKLAKELCEKRGIHV